MNFKKKTHEDQVIQSIDFSKKILDDYEFTSCQFLNCNFTESTFRNAQFDSCTFKVCNFGLVKVDGIKLQNVTFEECKLVGIDFYKCDKKFFTIKLKKSFLQYCNFTDLNMKFVSFKGSKLRDCYFTNTCLIAADFTDTDLSGTLFHNADLTKANFCEAQNYGIDVRVNKLKNAKFSFPEAVALLRNLEIELN